MWNAVTLSLQQWEGVGWGVEGRFLDIHPNKDFDVKAGEERGIVKAAEHEKGNSVIKKVKKTLTLAHSFRWEDEAFVLDRWLILSDPRFLQPGINLCRHI